MSGLDLILLAVIGLSALVGFWRGFVVEVMGLMVWIAAFWLAFQMGPAASGLYDGVVEAQTARWVLGYATVFLLALIVGGLATWLIGKLVKSTGLSGTDRLIGLLFGAARGWALAAIVVLMLSLTPMPTDDSWRDSRVIPLVQPMADWFRGWLPDVIAQRIGAPLPAADVPPGPYDPTPADDPRRDG